MLNLYIEAMYLPSRNPYKSVYKQELLWQKKYNITHIENLYNMIRRQRRHPNIGRPEEGEMRSETYPEAVYFFGKNAGVEAGGATSVLNIYISTRVEAAAATAEESSRLRRNGRDRLQSEYNVSSIYRVLWQGMRAEVDDSIFCPCSKER